ncbi:hypothetical protein SB725_32510, partial [Pseudomonas sp. SIMBA_041]|uniref:hypothetical protein n=1 Tax=Pseudomonas sp. SIMBA_041 TaxID=3085782 RepID=UPI00397D1AF0
AGFTVTDPEWILPFPDPASPTRYASLQNALDYVANELALHGKIAIEIATSATLTMTGPLAVDLPAGTTLELRAADGARPTLLL